VTDGLVASEHFDVRGGVGTEQLHRDLRAKTGAALKGDGKHLPEEYFRIMQSLRPARSRANQTVGERRQGTGRRVLSVE
jgi:hypothetical protein